MKWIKRAGVLLASLLLAAVISHSAEFTTVRAAGEDQAPLIPINRQTVQEAMDAAPALPADSAAPMLPELIKPEPESKPEREAEEELPVLSVIEPEPIEPIEEEGPRFPEGEDWQLLLVNPWNEMPQDYEVHLAALSNGLKIDEKAYGALNDMLGACQEEGLHPLVISAYRTQSKQTALYNNKIARLRSAGYSKSAAIKEAGRWVARPGTSEHQLGLAVDIVSASNQSLTKSQERTAEQKWLIAHCWEYGFILRYPNDKSEITGIGYEPWHYRYVGVDIALDIRDSGLCFEEYLLLREDTLGSRE